VEAFPSEDVDDCNSSDNWVLPDFFPKVENPQGLPMPPNRDKESNDREIAEGGAPKMEGIMAVASDEVGEPNGDEEEPKQDIKRWALSPC
jgi:hypothetical protein